MKKVDFIGLGAAKSGSTWLADAMRKHPDIYLPASKELQYFNRLMPYSEIPNKNREKPENWYHAHFAKANSKQMKGEISPVYLNDEKAARNIYAYNADIKLFVILRNPVQQVYSLYNYLMQTGFTETATLDEILGRYPKIKNSGQYYQQLKRYYDLFPANQIAVFLYDELKADPEKMLSEVYAFLGSETYYPDNVKKKSNVTRGIRHSKLNHQINKARNFIHRNGLQWILPVLRYTGIVPLAEFLRDRVNTRSFGKRPQMSPQEEQMLKNYYANEVIALEKLINKDLSNWK
jgi:hypothetical protein